MADRELHDHRRGFDAWQAVLWARASRRRLDAAAEAPTQELTALALVDQVGDWLHGLQALHSSLAAVRALTHDDPNVGTPMDVGRLDDLRRRVRDLRAVAASEMKRIGEPGAFLVRREGDGLVARTPGGIVTLTFDEWRDAVDLIEGWAGSLVDP